MKNFRGFKYLTITFPLSNITVFAGINGSGKSSILDCIAMFLSRFVSKLTGKEAEFSLTENDINVTSSQAETFNTISINVDEEPPLSGELSWSVSETLSPVKESIHGGHERTLSHYIDGNLHVRVKTDPSLKLPVLAYYQTDRLVLSDTVSEPQDAGHQFSDTRFFAYEGAFERKITDLSAFISWFKSEEDLENEMKIRQKDFNAVNRNLEVVRHAVTTFLNKFPSCNYSDLRMERRRRDKTFTFHALTESSLIITKDGQELRIGQLSAGEQSLLLMVCDIARRLAIANPDPINALNGRGIVLIDEMELHLHPSWQRYVVPCISHTFPNIQFIVTTHSPQVLSNAEKEDVQILENFKIVEKTPHTKGRDSNSVLFEVQGVEKRPEPYKNKLRELYRLIDEEQTEGAKIILSELTEKFGENDAEIVRANIHIEYTGDADPELSIRPRRSGTEDNL